MAKHSASPPSNSPHDGTVEKAATRKGKNGKRHTELVLFFKAVRRSLGILA